MPSVVLQRKQVLQTKLKNRYWHEHIDFHATQLVRKILLAQLTILAENIISGTRNNCRRTGQLTDTCFTFSGCLAKTNSYALALALLTICISNGHSYLWSKFIEQNIAQSNTYAATTIIYWNLIVAKYESNSIYHRLNTSHDILHSWSGVRFSLLFTVA